MFWNILNSAAALFAVFWSVKTSNDTKRRERPSIVFKDLRVSSDRFVDRAFGSYQLCFVNLGSREAINITISEKSIEQYPFLTKWNEIRRELPSHGGMTVCARGTSSFEKSISEIDRDYEDASGKKYSTSFKNGKFVFS